MNQTSKQRKHQQLRQSHAKQTEYDAMERGPSVITWSMTHKPDYSGKRGGERYEPN